MGRREDQDSSDSDTSEDEYDDISNAEEEPLAPPKPWDVFEVRPPEVDSGSAAAMVWVQRFEVVMLVVAYILTFLIVLVSSVISKGTTLFIISQVSVRDRILEYCNEDGQVQDKTKDYIVDRSRPSKSDPNYQNTLDSLEQEQLAWIWVLILAFVAPELVGTFLRSLRIVLFKTYSIPKLTDFLLVFIMETLHVIGLVVLAFLAFPQLDSAHAVVLTNCVGLIPGLLLLMNRSKKDKLMWLKTPMDIFAILAQLSGALVWPILQATDSSMSSQTLAFPWSLTIGLILVSFGWWETFATNEESAFKPVRWMSSVRLNMIEKTRYFTYLFISLWKSILFFGGAWLIASTGSNSLLRHPSHMFDFDLFKDSFDSHWLNVSERMDVVLEGQSSDAYEELYMGTIMTLKNSPLWALLVQIGASYIAYIFAKFASKVQIQGFSFSFPLSAVVPICATLLLSACGARAKDRCAFHNFMPDYIFFECPTMGDYFDYLWQEQVWLWALWFISQIWITAHIWFPKSPRLASTEDIFGTPMYCSLLIDQSLILNRRADGQSDLKIEEWKNERDEDLLDHYEHLAYETQSSNTKTSSNRRRSQQIVKESDKVTKIYGCATMWHENIEEMMEMLKSLFRVDMDYSARRLAQKYMDVMDQDFYEWETHILFDDAFELGNNEEEEQIVNQFVKQLVRIIDEAGSFVHCKKIRVKPPVRIPTPYGGRLVWTLPGKTKIVCHLKDKSKIRHKKRWSQCMYMYYLLGYKLMELPIADERKQAMADNTYLLALDGDIDFQPSAVTRLVDLMKKNKNLGAACGRILPTGSGFMVWYQKFEYAIGHWLQKATEHIMGCVLCSPGCFSLFRASALMDFNVMRMYTTKSEMPMHFVQYDQGEDRWLCTLILQRGWRVEYSAASDAYTACPEGFNEFFNQRRRWMPSTIANIFDLLSDYKNVVKVNPDISIFYIAYQIMMMTGTILGPGTIILMLVGAFSTAFSISTDLAMILNFIPMILFMMICFTLKSDIQLFVAQLLSALYAFVMMAVLVGIMLQISTDGPLAPSSLSVFAVAGAFILAAIMHPQEFWCLPYGVIYYITIPAMYLLLVIYSIFNLNVVSWGTREVPKKLTKQELEEQQKAAEAAQKEAMKKKKEGGLLGFLMQKAGSSGNVEKGGLEFSLANLFKCMCFTHEDPEANPQQQLVKIAASIEDVNTKLKKIENSVRGHATSSVSFGGSSFRKQSMRNARSRIQSSAGLSPMNSLVPPPEGQGLLDHVEEMHDELSEGQSDSDLEVEEVKIKRDDLVNPYWIEDKDLRNGKRDFLSGHETQFWKDLIDKYLMPLIKDAEKEKKQARELIGLRNQMVFSFSMLNGLFILVVYMLQRYKDTIFIPWPLGCNRNITYSNDEQIGPLVEIDKECLQFEPVGLIFVVFFFFILIIQVAGMLLHRWATISHIIATTELSWCNKDQVDETGDGTLEKQAIQLVHALQRDNASKSDNHLVSTDPKVTATTINRRGTVHQISANIKDANKQAQYYDHEREFRNKFRAIKTESFESSDNPTLRRLSMKPDALKAFTHRRDSYLRRKSTIRRLSSVQTARSGSINEAFEGDSAISADEYSGSAMSRNSQFVEFVDEGGDDNQATSRV